MRLREGGWYFNRFWMIQPIAITRDTYTAGGAKRFVLDYTVVVNKMVLYREFFLKQRSVL